MIWSFLLQKVHKECTLLQLDSMQRLQVSPKNVIIHSSIFMAATVKLPFSQEMAEEQWDTTLLCWL